MKKIDQYNFFSLHTKMSETTYYQRNKEVILNRTKDYYENNKEVLRERERRRKNRYHNMSEKDKQKLKEYQKIIERLKNQHNFLFVFFLLYKNEK